MKNQVFFIEYEEFTRRRSFPPVNFKVDYLGEIMLVSDVHVAGKIISQSPKCGSFLKLGFYVGTQVNPASNETPE